MLSSRHFMNLVGGDILIWRRIMHCLNIPVKDDDIESIHRGDTFPSSFQRFIEIRRNIKKNLNGVMQKSSRLHYNIEFLPQGKMESEDDIINTNSKNKTKYRTIANLITHSTIAYDFDESHFVLIQSRDQSRFWHSYRPQTTNGSIPISSRVSVYNIKGGVCLYLGFSDLPFEIAGQDLEVYQGFLFLLPIKQPNNDATPNEILLVYSILDGTHGEVLELATSFTPGATNDYPDRHRLPPQVYKESGEKRIYILDQEDTCKKVNFIDILITVPCPVWTILILKLSISDVRLLLVKEVAMKEASLAALGQIFTADQKVNTTALALYTSTSTSNKRFGSLIAIIDTPPPYKPTPSNYVEFKKTHFNTPMIEVVSGKELPNFLDLTFNLFGRVQEMKLYYISATNYYHTPGGVCLVHAKARKPVRECGFYAPVLVFLLASDQIVLYSSNHPNGQGLNLHSLFGNSNRCLSKNWHHSELQVLDKVSFKNQTKGLNT